MFAKKLSVNSVLSFLKRVDQTFPIPLSQKQDLNKLAIKYAERATIFVEIKNDEICAMVVGYTDNVDNDMAYISMVATVPEAYGKGYATKLVREFIEFSRKKKLKAVHLYSRSIVAIQMYKKLGFKQYIIENEARPDDVHLIIYIEF